jgi:biopolymer transport protein ExbD
LRHGNQGLRFLHRPRRTAGDEGLISLINIIFLLLIFFMIVGRMETAAPFGVKPPVSVADTRPLPEELILLLAADGRVAIGNETVRLETLEPRLQQWVQSTTGGAAPGGASPTVALKADRGVRSRELRTLLDVLRRAGFGQVKLLTDLVR